MEIGAPASSLSSHVYTLADHADRRRSSQKTKTLTAHARSRKVVPARSPWDLETQLPRSPKPYR